MKCLIVIPARYGSSRYPGKPLAQVVGKTVLERTCNIAKAASGVSDVIVATDDDRIKEHALSLDVNAVMTSPECKNGTERVFAALKEISADYDSVINLQGDAILTPPWVLDAIVGALTESSTPIVTPAVKLTLEQYDTLKESKASGDPGGTTVVFNNQYQALYFSKALIPFLRNFKQEDLPVFRHIGIYGYQREGLEKYLTLSEGVLEKVEGLEQLRALEAGMQIQVVPVDYNGRSHWSIDSPEDVAVAEQIIKHEGELVP